jgi:protein-disulfide isomerase/uncharacterized membrane protein
MKNKSNLLIASLLVTIGLFVYLTVHHYAVQLGMNGPGLCNVNATLNCDAAAVSSYAEIFKIPIAVLGLCFNFIMLAVVLFKTLGWSEESETQNGFIRTVFLFASVISLALGLISIFQIHVICPFCLGTYIFTFINTYLVWSVFSPANFGVGMFTRQGNIYIGITILVFAWFVSGAIQDNYGLNEMKKIAPEKVAIWQNSQNVYTFSDLGLVQNPESKVTIVEFADFKCSHCKMASTSLHNYMQGHPEVKFVFKSFPLDGTCNPQITQSGDGSRCKMATWALCAEQTAKKGWDVHKYYFDNQESLFSITDMKETNIALAKSLNLNYDDVEKCSEAVDTYETIKKMVAESKEAKVEGTPTIFLNGKKLEYGHFPQVLKAAIETIKK